MGATTLRSRRSAASFTTGICSRIRAQSAAASSRCPTSFSSRCPKKSGPTILKDGRKVVERFRAAVFEGLVKKTLIACRRFNCQGCKHRRATGLSVSERKERDVGGRHSRRSVQQRRPRENTRALASRPGRLAPNSCRSKPLEPNSPDFGAAPRRAARRTPRGGGKQRRPTSKHRRRRRLRRNPLATRRRREPPPPADDGSLSTNGAVWLGTPAGAARMSAFTVRPARRGLYAVRWSGRHGHRAAGRSLMARFLARYVGVMA